MLAVCVLSALFIFSVVVFLDLPKHVLVGPEPSSGVDVSASFIIIIIISSFSFLVSLANGVG